jgi:hypothetical protein
VKEYKREYPLFSLCGLNCGLCPQYHSKGASRCPGCGGEDFHLKHPSCAVITCAKKHGVFEYCFQCAKYPCEKYKTSNEKDSFISYKNVAIDLQKAAFDMRAYKSELNEKVSFLEYLLENHNDGRKKSFYCLALNLLDLPDLREIRAQIEKLKTHPAGHRSPVY